MSHEIFETNPNLEKVHVTSDNTPFYQENDAKNHAKSLKDKTVETVYNEKFLEVVGTEELTGEDKELAEFEAAEKEREAQEAADQKEKEDAAAAEQKEAEDKAKLAESLLAFDPETTKYPEAVKLFKALGLEAENEKKDTIYPLLAAAKATAQEGVKNQD